MEEVDTILPKQLINEKHGVAGTILPVVGMIPLLGFPFAVASIVLGMISLNKINSNPKIYKGKGVAINSIIWGVLGIISTVVTIFGLAYVDL
jgi:hypothetical protein